MRELTIKNIPKYSHDRPDNEGDNNKKKDDTQDQFPRS